MAIAVARTGETRSPGSKKCRNARKKPHTARATPARCTTASATPAAGGRPPRPGPNGEFSEMWKKSPPYMLRIPSNATTKRRGNVCRCASVADATGVTRYPPRAPISRTASSAAAYDRALAATSDSSYHCEARDLRWRRTASRTRAPQTTASGTTAVSSATRSATMTQASTAPAATGTYQRRGARSSIKKTSSSGSWVPR